MNVFTNPCTSIVYRQLIVTTHLDYAAGIDPVHVNKAMLLTINVSPLLNIDEPRNCPCLPSLVALAEVKH